MENLNAEKVKKALEIHTGILDKACEECPYNRDAHDEICLDVLAVDTLTLITSQEQRIKELKAECKQWRSDWEKNQKRWEIAYDELDKEKHDLELTLVGVMFAVDKWLDGAELKQDEVNRAITMREKTLQIVERLTEENERLVTALANYDRQTEVRIAEEYYTAEAYEELREENERLRAVADMSDTTLTDALRIVNEFCESRMKRFINYLKDRMEFCSRSEYNHTTCFLVGKAFIDKAFKEFSEGKNEIKTNSEHS